MTAQTTSAVQALPRLPDEVVTRALVRDVELPGGAGTMALVTLDNGRDHTRPSTFGPAGLASLSATLGDVAARAARGRIVAAGLTGKPFVFAAGADLTMMQAGRTREQAELVARAGHDVLRRLGELGVPSFAFVNGAALGGGIEAALHCTYRTLSAGAGALALPECFLGLVPGWGGCYLLPNLIGPVDAVKMIIENPLNHNRMLQAPAAHELGLADVLLEPADFLAQSLRWAAGVLTGQVRVQRREVDRSEASWEGAVSAARQQLDERLHGAAPAPYRALELIRQARTVDRDTAFAAEDAAIADLAVGPQLRAGIYAFDLVNRRAKRPSGAPSASLARPVTSVGVVGAGLMATQLALLFARRLKVPVVLTDLDSGRVERGVARVHGEIDELLRRRRISTDHANRLRGLVTGGTDLVAYENCDLVIEAVFEDLAVKRAVFADLEKVVADSCLLLTNTSSLSVTAMADGLAHPERVAGFHFFNPVAVLPLVEVVRAEHTHDAALATAFAVGRQLGKSCVLVKDAPAFVVNRLLTRLIGEVSRAVDAGTPPEVADRALSPLGLPMTPFLVLQLVGSAVALDVTETLHAAYPDRFEVSGTLRRLVEAGKPGLWSWNADGPYLDDETAALLPAGGAPLSQDEVRTAVLEALAEEIRLILDEAVVAAPQDVDTCLLLGAGWPLHLGGITPYLDAQGISQRVTGRRFLPPGVASLPE